MLRFSGESTALNYGVTVAKEIDAQEKCKLGILRFQSRYLLLTGSKVVLHQKPVHHMMRATTTASGIATFIFVPLCDKLNSQCHFLSILKSDVIS